MAMPESAAIAFWMRDKVLRSKKSADLSFLDKVLTPRKAQTYPFWIRPRVQNI